MRSIIHYGVAGGALTAGLGALLSGRPVGRAVYPALLALAAGTGAAAIAIGVAARQGDRVTDVILAARDLDRMPARGPAAPLKVVGGLAVPGGSPELRPVAGG